MLVVIQTTHNGIRSSAVAGLVFWIYIQVSRDWIRLCTMLPYYLMVTAAGNSHRSRIIEAPISWIGFQVVLIF